MLTQIGIEGESELIIPILGATPKESLLVRQITGLGPPDVDLFIGEYSRDGGTYQGRRVGNRNPVITMDLNPNPVLGETVSGLRELVYKYFLDPLVEADYVKVNLYDDEDRVRYFVGYTEKIETEVFDVETIAQISMICPDPYLRDNEEVVLSDTSGWATVPPFTYSGTAETGFRATIHIDSTTDTLILENNPVTTDPLDPRYPRGRMIINRDFVAGDTVVISTVPGERGATVTPSGGSESSIIANLTPTSPWMQLHSQSNTMKVYGATPASTPASIRELVFTQTYWGV